MYQYYELTIGNATDTHVMLYELKTHRPAQDWATLMAVRSTADIEDGYNSWRGVFKNFDIMVADLQELVTNLNQWVPEKITWQWDSNNLQESLNALHTHFPEHYYIQTDETRLSQLYLYNDMIHNMENYLRRNDSKHDTMWLRVYPKSPTLMLNDDDYAHFQLGVAFGEIILGYPIVGRHPFEIFRSNDVNVPPEQIKPHSVFSTIHHIHFNKLEVSKESFADFYYKSGIQWPYKLDDPKLAVGGISAGKLKYLDGVVQDNDTIYNTVYNCNKIINWKIT